MSDEGGRPADDDVMRPPEWVLPKRKRGRPKKVYTDGRTPKSGEYQLGGGGSTKRPIGTNLLPGEPFQRITLHVPTAALERFVLMYPRRGALRVCFTAAIRAAIERPDLCQFLERTYGRDAYRLAGKGFRKENPSLEHPLRYIQSMPVPLKPVADPDTSSPEDDPSSDPSHG